MNLENKLNYISRKAHNNNSRLSNIKDILKTNLNNLYGIIRINNYIICHGGINPNFLDKYKEHFNSEKEFIENYNYHVKQYLLSSSYELSDLLKDNESPFWDRTNGLNSSYEECKLSKKQCEKIFKDNILNIPHPIDYIKLIVAHCPQVINNTTKGINLVGCSNNKNKIWRVDIAMSRAFDNYHDLSVIRGFLKNINSTEIDLDFILQFNIKRQNNEVQILKITNDTPISEEVIIGKSSLEYFYIDVFKNNYKLMLLYLLHDIELYYDIEETHHIPILKKEIFYIHYKKINKEEYLNYTVYNKK